MTAEPLDKQPISSLCITILNAFTELQCALKNLKITLCEQDANLPAWFQAPIALKDLPSVSVREKTFDFINQLSYLDQQAPKEILLGPGLLAASDQTLAQIETVNLAKLHFKESILALKSLKLSLNHPHFKEPFDELLKQRPSQLSQSLQTMGMARLHLKQCYRTLPTLPARPQKIAWTWANTRAIQKISAKEAFLRLNKIRHKPGIEQQLQKLEGLSEETPLAIVQTLAPHLRANILFPKQTALKRFMLKGAVPIFYPMHYPAPFSPPEIKPPKTKAAKNPHRVVRSDLKINPEVFLPAIRAHQYQFDLS